MTETTAGAGVLSGIKVVDFGHFVAGPLTAVMLADQGAQVVHVDRPGAELAESDAFLKRGKRRGTLDLKDPADAAIAARLAASADVVIENFRPGVMDRHGLAATRAGGAAADLLLAVWLRPRRSARGDPRLGGRGRRRHREPKPHSGNGSGTYECADGRYIRMDPIGGSVMTAFAASLGIFHRTRTGAGGLVTASLAQTATYHQAIFMLATQAGGSMLSRAALRRSAPGRSSGTTKARDGWIFLGMKPSQLPSLRSVPWLAAAAGLSPADATAVAEALSAALAERSTAEATHALQQAGVGAHEVLTTEQVMTSEPARSLASA